MHCSEIAKILGKVVEEARENVFCTAEILEKKSQKTCTANLKTSVKILADLQLSLRSSGTIFTDPQGKKGHRSVQILKESSIWGVETDEWIVTKGRPNSPHMVKVANPVFNGMALVLAYVTRFGAWVVLFFSAPTIYCVGEEEYNLCCVFF